MQWRVKIPNTFILFLIILLPTAIELLVGGLGNVFMAPFFKIVVHFVLPILFVAHMYDKGLRQSIKEIVTDRKKLPLKEQLKWGTIGGLVAFFIILSALAVVSPFIELSAITSSLNEKIKISKELFLIVGAWIIFVNPIMEEFFWRGFVLEEMERLFDYKLSKQIGLYFTGILFALHHVIIIYEWFNLWQFIVIVCFLSFAGVALNIMKDKTGSILAPFITHTFADIAIIIVGMIAFGFIGG